MSGGLLRSDMLAGHLVKCEVSEGQVCLQSAAAIQTSSSPAKL